MSTPTAIPATPSQDRADAIAAIADFMRGFSFEATRPSADEVAALAAIVPAGTRVYVSAVPTRPAQEAIEAAMRLARGRLRAGAASRGAQLRDRPRARRIPRPRQRRGRRTARAGDRRRSRPARRRIPQLDRGDRRRRLAASRHRRRSASPAIPTAIRAYRSRSSTARSPTRSGRPRRPGWRSTSSPSSASTRRRSCTGSAGCATSASSIRCASGLPARPTSRRCCATRSAAACGPRPRGSPGRPAWCGSCSPCRRPTRWCARSRAGARRAGISARSRRISSRSAD